MIKVDADMGKVKETKTKWMTGEKQGNECNKEKARKYSDLKLTR